MVRCTRGLDFEREREYTLSIGTLENQSGAPGSITKVVVEVEVSAYQKFSMSIVLRIESKMVIGKVLKMDRNKV